MRRVKTASTGLVVGLTRRSPAFTRPYRPAPSNFVGQLWAGLTRSTPAFTGAQAPPDLSLTTAPITDADETSAQAEAGAVFTSIFGDSKRAAEFNRDATHGLALALSLSRPLGLELALAKNTLLTHSRSFLVYLDRDVAREFALQHTISEALVLALDLARTRPLDYDRAAQLDRALQPALERAAERARRLTFDVARDLDLDRDHATLLYRALNYDLDRALTTDRRHDLALVRDLARARGSALDRLSAIAADSGLHRVGFFRRALAMARKSALAIAGGLSRDLKRADLRGANLRAADLTEADLRGVIWSDSTSWPVSLRGEIQASSTEIEPGVYRVREEHRRSSAADLSALWQLDPS